MGSLPHQCFLDYLSNKLLPLVSVFMYRGTQGKLSSRVGVGDGWELIARCPPVVTWSGAHHKVGH